MKLLIFGSSLVRDLQFFDTEDFHFIRAIRFKFIYRPYSGQSFEYILAKPHLIDKALKCKPDYVLVIFGANSISTEVEKKTVLESCRNFYNLLYERLMQINSRAKVIATEIPMRYVYTFDHDTPQPEEYRKFRRSMNSKIECLKSKHHILRLSGQDRLENEICLKDGVHYTPQALDTFFTLIIKVLQYILDKDNLAYCTSLSYQL